MGVDDGMDFPAKRSPSWAKLLGSLDQNSYIERFNRTYRTEILDLYMFKNLEQVRKITGEWLELYNTERMHEALNHMTPVEY